MIRKARLSDLPAIMELVAETKKAFREDGSPQWKGSYPERELFVQDIESQSLFVLDDGGIRAMIAVNDDIPEEYAPLPWKNTQCWVIHRLAVAKPYWHLGYGRMMMEYAIGVAKAAGVPAVHSDTLCLNHRMQSLFTSLGFRPVGKLCYPSTGDELYLAFERALS